MSACQSVMERSCTGFRKTTQGLSVPFPGYRSHVHVGERIKRAMGARKVSVVELARRTGYAKSTIYDILRGDHEPKSLHKFADALEANLRWLETERGQMLTGGDEGASEAGAMVPHFAVSASMGLGIDVTQHLELVRNISIDINELRKVASFSAPENLSFITGYGNSMEPTFHDGDVLLIDQGVTDIKFDAVYALERGTELFIKRIQRRPDGSFVMLSDNKLYEAQPIRKQDMHEFRVRGRVVLAWNAKKV